MTLNSDRHVMKCQCLGEDQGGTPHSRHFGFNYSRGTGILRALLCVAVEWDCLPFLASSRAQSPTFLAAGAKKTILEDSFSIDPGWWGALFRDDSSTLHLSCTLFLLFSISSTSDHQALEPRDWGPLL